METDILCKTDVAARGLVRAGVLFAALGGKIIINSSPDINLYAQRFTGRYHGACGHPAV